MPLKELKVCSAPCPECPFKKNSLAGWLGSYSAIELHQTIMNETPFPCHMTHPNSDVKVKDVGDKYPYCAGALQYMKKAGKLPLKPQLNILLKSIDRTDLGNILSVKEFFEHHN